MKKLLPWKIYAGLSSSIYILFIARIINRMGDFIHMFLTLYLSQVLLLDESRIGFFVMLSAVSTLGGAFIGGKLSDQAGRKKY